MTGEAGISLDYNVTTPHKRLYWGCTSNFEDWTLAVLKRSTWQCNAIYFHKTETGDNCNISCFDAFWEEVWSIVLGAIPSVDRLLFWGETEACVMPWNLYSVGWDEHGKIPAKRRYDHYLQNIHLLKGRQQLVGQLERLGHMWKQYCFHWLLHIGNDTGASMVLQILTRAIVDWNQC